MTQEDKELLLKDLCARVPYGVYISCKWKKVAPNGTTGAIFTLDSKFLDEMYNTDCSDVPFDEFMPYLRPMSSMTEEEKSVLLLCNAFIEPRSTEYKVDFYNQHHLDYRDLIEKGLALEAPERMYIIK